MDSERTLSFEKSDRLGLRKFCSQLESFVQVEHNFVEGSLVVSLNGGFGSGKTTFLQMWENDLRERRKTNMALPLPITLNAWESDYRGDALLAIISVLSRVVKEIPSANEETASSQAIREAVKDIAWFGLALANGLVAKATGLDSIKAGDVSSGKNKARRENSEEQIDLLEMYEERSRSLTRLKRALKDCFGGDNPRAIILVDELDRCRPDYAIEYLETIKHIFDIRGLIFILAVDKHQLKSSAEALFGNGLKFDEYYRKFVHRNVFLPLPDKQGLNRLVANYVDRFWSSGNVDGFKRFSLFQVDRIENVEEMIAALALTPRQINEVFRIVGHAMALEKATGHTLPWAQCVGTAFMATLSVTHPLKYRAIGLHLFSIDDLGSLVRELFTNDKQFRWWLNILVSGYWFDENELSDEEVFRMHQRLGAIAGDTNVELLKAAIFRTMGGWLEYSHDAPLTQVFKTIEGVHSFSR